MTASTSTQIVDPSWFSVSRLAEQLEGVEVEPLIAAALESSPDYAAVLALAASVAGRPVELQSVANAVPDLEDVEWIPWLVAACTGDRLGGLLNLIEKNTMSAERDALGLLLAAHLAGDEPPPRLLRVARRLCAAEVGMGPSAELLAAAVDKLREHIDLEVPRWVEVLAPFSRGVARRLIQPLHQPLSESLPKHRIHTTGETSRRQQKKVGRNDPCPCGSGKKYKKCCGRSGAPEPLAPDAALALAAAEAKQDTRAPAELTAFAIRGMRVRELCRLDPMHVDLALLDALVSKLLGFSRLEEAARALDAWEERRSSDAGDIEDIVNHRIDLICKARRAGMDALVKCQRQRLAGVDSLSFANQALLALLDAPAARVAMEAAALAAFTDEGGTSHITLAYTLLDLCPALGILYTRGVLSPERELDSVTLLDAVEIARAELDLPPNDPAGELYDLMLDRKAEAMLHDRLTASSEEAARAAERVETLRRQAREASEQLIEYQKEIRRKQHEIERSRWQAKSAAPITGVAPRPPFTPQDDEEIRRLRAKVEDLKRLVSEGNTERASLRRDLAEASRDLRQARAREEPPASELSDDTMIDEIEVAVDAASVGPRQILVPLFERKAAAALDSLPRNVARDALATVAALASGKEEAWRRVKKLHRLETVLSARVGLHHRLLFELDKRRLRVLNIVSREDLFGVIERMR